MKYKNYQRNHVILPGREEALESFLKQDYKGMQHKLRNAVSSNSEDALTWSCFDISAHYPTLDKATALDELLDAALASGRAQRTAEILGHDHGGRHLRPGRRKTSPSDQRNGNLRRRFYPLAAAGLPG